MHRFESKDRIYNDNGVIVRIVTAMTDIKKKSLTTHYETDVYMEDENGVRKCRCLYYSNFGGGYRVIYPGEVGSLYGNNGGNTFIQEDEEYGPCNELCIASGAITDFEKELICSKYNDFRYVLNKWSGSRAKVLEVLKIWKEHKEVELMLAAKMYNLVFTPGFWKRTIKNQKALITFLKKNPAAKGLKLSQLDEILKNNITLKEYKRYYEEKRMHYYKISYDTWKYLKENAMLDYENISLYHDYVKLLRFSTHDRKNPYWKYPKDLQAKHDRLLVEVGNLKELEQKKALEKKQKNYFKAVEKFLNLEGTYAGYKVYIPQTVEEISEHAKALNQCLVSCDYITRVINKRCLLVFIKKKDKSIATAELLEGNKLGQFYANELDRNNCRPTEKVKKAFNLWLEHKIELEKEGAQKNGNTINSRLTDYHNNY